MEKTKEGDRLRKYKLTVELNECGGNLRMNFEQVDDPIDAVITQIKCSHLSHGGKKEGFGNFEKRVLKDEIVWADEENKELRAS